MNKIGTLDTIRMQVMWNRLISVVEEQAQTLMRTAFSPMVRECGDLSAGVFDARGRMLAQAITGTPGHVNSMAESVNHFIDHFPLETMVEGDIYITNDPWMGTGHLKRLCSDHAMFSRWQPGCAFFMHLPPDRHRWNRDWPRWHRRTHGRHLHPHA